MRCRHCNQQLLPTATRCPGCQQAVAGNEGSTDSESIQNDGRTTQPPRGPSTLPPPQRPDPDELPSWITALQVGLALSTLLFGLILNLPFHQVDRRAQFESWIQEARSCLRTRCQQTWRVSDAAWPPAAPIPLYVRSTTEVADGAALVEPLLRDAPEAFAQVIQIPEQEWFQLDTSRRTEVPSMVVTFWDYTFTVGIDVRYHAPSPKSRQSGTLVAFSFRKEMSASALYWLQLAQLLLVALAAWGVYYWVVLRFRARRQADYERAAEEHGRKISELRARLDRARVYAKGGMNAQALIEVNAVLDVLPGLSEARELKAALAQSGGAYRSEPISAAERPSSTAPTIYLRILGTPHSYRATPGAESVSLGRQRRKTGEADNEGNDIVLRVDGRDQQSLRISRRHLEIQRLGESFYVRDHSRGGTRLNNQELPRDRPIPLRSGDRLLVAGVLGLEFQVRVNFSPGEPVGPVVVRPEAGKEGVIIEATIGDMVTVD